MAYVVAEALAEVRHGAVQPVPPPLLLQSQVEHRELPAPLAPQPVQDDLHPGHAGLGIALRRAGQEALDQCLYRSP